MNNPSMKYIWLEIFPETDTEGRYNPRLLACHTCNEHDFLLALNKLLEAHDINICELVNEYACDSIEYMLSSDLLKRGTYMPFTSNKLSHRYYLTKFITYVAWKAKGFLQINDQQVRKIYF
ncbi:hypothetical protein PZB74_02120 [Porifericola rhodea]|uniref:hypothetical protein n=1 Tax=Porifericola rhodea TaxID=930972 RepID=UPI0026670F04|nr:hypothetical protein [Porifericola rhodea]WKN32149.1 hypothetical protein PZB74_02120 [Porifericola rhodea]